MLTQSEALELKRRHAGHLLRLAGVSGLGVEKDDGGYVVAVYLASDEARKLLPKDLDGHAYRTVVSGSFQKR